MAKKNKLSRRDSLKYLASGTVGAGFILTGCEPTSPPPEAKEEVEHMHHHEGTAYKLTEEDQALMKERFFTPHEMATVTVLANLIIPADDRSGNAEDAGVPEFIEFMMKDMPTQQTRMRGGLRWLDLEAIERYEKAFVEADETQQKAILDDIAYPDIAKPEFSHGVQFFNRFRNFVASGFWTSKMGTEDLQYMGNQPFAWNGAPQEWLDRLGVSYEEEVTDA